MCFHVAGLIPKLYMPIPVGPAVSCKMPEGEGQSSMVSDATERANRVVALQQLLQEYRAQNDYVNSIRDELYDLRSDPGQYFKKRKTFLWQVYNKKIDRSRNSMMFDVVVRVLRNWPSNNVDGRQHGSVGQRS